MSELLAQTRTELERAGYLVVSRDDQLLFENETVMGFVRYVVNIPLLHASWKSWEETFISASSLAIRRAGMKAWNLYSVFLTSDTSTSEAQGMLSDIEEDFELTRKIAKAGVISPDSLKRALYPLLPIQHRSDVEDADPIARLKPKLPPSFPMEILDIVLTTESKKQALEQILEQVKFRAH